MAKTIVAPTPEPKVRITINLDESVVNYFKTKANDVGSYQRLINRALKEHIAMAQSQTKKGE